MKTKHKSKTISVILAILLGLFTWLYTYKQDAWKFWLNLILNILLFWTIVVPIGTWIWAIVDACQKEE